MVDVDFKLRCLEPVVYRWKFDEIQNCSVPSIMYPCGKCIVCKERKRRQWALRMMNEKEFSKSCFFVTLTYSDENLSYYAGDVPCLNKIDYTNFVKALRKRVSFRFFGVGEYGSESFRPHYHFVFFLDKHINRFDFRKYIGECWKKGFNTVSTATYGRMYYIAKYTVKDSEHYIPTLKGFQTSSQSPPIGYKFFELNSQFYRDLSVNYMVTSSGQKCSLPRSFENHIKNALSESDLRIRKESLIKNASINLKHYLNQYNQHSKLDIISAQDTIIRRYKEKKRNNLNKV